MLSDKTDFLDFYSPTALAVLISQKLRARRLENNLSQEALSMRSGVSLGTLKRFESKAEISLKHLLMLAVVLNAGEEFTALFPAASYTSIDDLLKQQQQQNPRKRGRKKF